MVEEMDEVIIYLDMMVDDYENLVVEEVVVEVEIIEELFE